MALECPGKAVILQVGTGTQISLLQPAISARDSLLSKNTIRGYVRDWKDFFLVKDIGQITLSMCAAVTPEEVSSFRDKLILEKLSPGTIARKLTALRCLFDYLIERKTILMNPASKKLVRTPKRGTIKKMEWLSPSELKTVLRAIDRSAPEGRRDYALIMTDLHMGCRRSEVLQMRTDQFKDAGGKAYYVFRSKGEKERHVTINQDLEKVLAAYAVDRGSSPGWLFPGRNPENPLCGDMFWKIMKKYLDMVGIKKKVGTHGLRATFITVNLEKGTPISEIQKTVGHSRPDTTLGYARDLEAIKSRAPAAMEGLNAD